jgi:hypothetical protein
MKFNYTTFSVSFIFSCQDVQTPRRKVATTFTESEAKVKTESPFASFLTKFRDFKTQMASAGVDAVPHEDVSTPVSH